MPRAPILNREGFFKKLSDGTQVPLDWNLVNTSLGAMLEPRQFGPFLAPIETIDAKDAGFTRETEMDENVLQFQTSTGGQRLPTDFSA